MRKYENIFPSDLFEKVASEVSGSRWRYGHRSTRAMGYAHWNRDFAAGGAENGLDVSDNLTGVMREAWDYLRQTYFPGKILIRCYANAHTYGVEGYPHVDSKRANDQTLVIYINQDWRREWGGETMIYDGDAIVHAEIPKANSGIRFNGNQWHAARSVTRICPELRMSLMFKFAPEGSDTTRDRLQTFLRGIGAMKKRHKSGTLGGHLLGTYDALKAAGQPEAICLAGGSHSVFGTNAFKSACITMDEYSALADVVGDEAATLAKLFCTTERPKTLENALVSKSTTLDLSAGGTVEVTPDQLRALCIIEGANLDDQRSLGGYPNLRALWQETQSV